ncbi:MAG: TIGR01777 family protein [Flavobacteriales bacterium]|nr:TIGR01777 family protein [Flavobacteriales bacterium]
MAIILITGGSGLIGRQLTAALLRERHTVRWMSRRTGEQQGVHAFAWDLVQGRMEEAALEGVDHIVHLAGAGIADKRWSRSRVRELIESRTRGPELMLETCTRTGRWPRSIISASGVGYYGAVTSDHRYTEEDPPGTDTIARISVAWETAVDRWQAHTRVVKLRTAVVLAPDGGALQPLARLARWGLASPVGTGRQWLPWVHIDDLVNAYHHALDDERMNGAYNVVAANVMNKELMRLLAKVLRRPYVLPAVPTWAMKALLGELSSVLLGGSWISNEKLLATGFRFEHVALEETLRGLLDRN